MGKVGNYGNDRRFEAGKEKITKWLLADGWTIKDETAENAAWAVIAEDEQKKRVVFAQLNHRPDLVLAEARIILPEELRRQVRNLKPATEREELLWQIRFQLLNMGVKFTGVDSDPREIGITTRLYLENLNRNDFVRTVERVQDSILAVLWTIQRKLGQPGPDSESADGVTIH